MDLYWYVTDANDKLLKTGNWQKLPIRKTQDCFRKFDTHGATFVHLIDLSTGCKSRRTLEYAVAQTNESLKKEMVKELTKNCPLTV